jgi:hypothetical protein
MDKKLETSLIQLAKFMAGTSAPWWIIGSSAMVVAGVDGVIPDDVDVTADGPMLTQILEDAVGAIAEPLPHTKFRSLPYTRTKVVGGLDIEFQGDLDLWENGDWQRLKINSRIAVNVGDTVVYIASVEEQLAILRRFGRDKDLAKASLLEAFIARHST